MPSYSQNSEHEKDTTTENIQKVFGEVVKHYDNTFIKGYRPNTEQKKLFDAKRSKIEKDGKHNRSPSEAGDVAPFTNGKIPWPRTPSFINNLTKEQRAEFTAYVKDMGQFYHFAGFVQGTARHMGHPLRWGGDWDKDRDFSDQHFDDLVHFEEI